MEYYQAEKVPCMDSTGKKRVTAAKICKRLDQGLAIMERLAVFGLFAALFYFGFQFARSRLSPMQIGVFSMLGETWKAGALLLFPLFYLTIRTFLEQATEFWLLKRPVPGAPVVIGDKPMEIGKIKNDALDIEEIS